MTQAYMTIRPPQWAAERMEFGPLGLKPTSSFRSENINMSDEVRFQNPYKQMLSPPSKIWGDVFYGRVQQEAYDSAPIFPPVKASTGRRPFYRKPK